MREIGIDVSGQRSKSVEEFDGQSFDYVITVCDSARQVCPVFPAKASASIGISRTHLISKHVEYPFPTHSG